jgi:cell wall-associated NlpC family hydrolase
VRRIKTLLFIAAFLFLGIVIHNASSQIHHRSAAKPPPSVTTAQAIAYVKEQLGKPYLWGGTGPDAFDCSGLIQQAYHWGADLRTSQDQWAGLHHVDKPRDGDLVFFEGLLNPGEQPPGHVGIIISPGVMIDAYGGPYGVEYDSFGTPGSKQGLGTVWGYASP